MPFERQVKVRFAHCDPAGIVFYARYFEMLSGVVEDWFSDELHAPFRVLLEGERVVVPTAHFTVDFRRPSALGDILTFRLDVVAIGRTSMTLEIDVRCADEPRFTVSQVLVCVHHETLQPIPVPERLRSRITARPTDTPG